MQDGCIAALEPHLAASAREEIDADGLLFTVPFVDAHFHMDVTLSYGLPRVNMSGTLLEGIVLWGELKPELTQEALVERALQTATGQSRAGCWRSARTSAMNACSRSRRCSK